MVLATYGVAWLVKAGLEPPGVEMPDWTFNDMPLQLGQWHGQPTEMDPKIAVATEAAPGTIVNRHLSRRIGTQHLDAHRDVRRPAGRRLSHPDQLLPRQRMARYEPRRARTWRSRTS